MHFKPLAPHHHHPRARAGRSTGSSVGKLLAALAAVFAVAITPITFLPPAAGVPCSWPHVLAAIGAVALMFATRMAPRYVALRFAVFVPVLLMISISLPLAHGFRSGWLTMGGVMIKGLTCFTIMLVLVHTTPFEQLLRALRQLRVPSLFVATLAFMYRYLFVLQDELGRMRRARAARTFDASHRASLRTIAGLVGMLIVRSFERAERVHAAMLARGYDGNIRTLE